MNKFSRKEARLKVYMDNKEEKQKNSQNKSKDDSESEKEMIDRDLMPWQPPPKTLYKVSENYPK